VESPKILSPDPFGYWPRSTKGSSSASGLRSRSMPLFAARLQHLNISASRRALSAIAIAVCQTLSRLRDVLEDRARLEPKG